MNPKTLPTLFPHIRLFGKVDESMLSEFLRQQAALRSDEPVVFELSTSGGDADIGRRIAQELRLWQEKDHQEVFFFGKTYVFSAGITIMSAVPPSHRFLTADCELLIHERKMQKTLTLEGALRGCKAVVMDALAQIESGQRLEREGFATLVNGTRLSVADLKKKVFHQEWYLTAQEAVEIGLVAATV